MWLKLKQILGTPNGLAWSQVHHFLPQEKKKRDARGELALLVSIKGESGSKNLSVLGREIISRFHEEYFGNLEGKVMERLKEALVKVGQEKSAYFQEPAELSLLALVLWRKVAYLGIWHQGRVLLRRQGKTGTLLVGERSQARLASGLVREDDLFFLATKDLMEKVPQGMITAALSTEDLETIGEALIPVVHAREKQGGLAAVAVKVISGEKEELPVEKEKKAAILTARIKSFLEKLKLSKNLSVIWQKLASLLSRLSPKTSALTVAIGFLILLSLSVFFGWRKRTEQRRLAKVAELSSLIEEKLDAAGAIKGLDPESSLKLINEAKEAINQLIELDQIKGENYQAQAESLAAGLGGEAIEPQLYYDLSLIGEGVVTSSFFSNGQELLIIDQKGERLIKINLAKKTGDIIAGGEKLSGANLVAFSGKRIYLIKSNLIGWLKEEQFQEVAKLEEEDQIIDADSWLGNLYLLDRANEQIWKYPTISSGLGKRRAWLKTKSSFSFSRVVDMVIDGYVWLLLENGRIYKFLSGREDRFNQQLPSGVGRAQYLAVAQDGETVVFWDQEKKTVWVFNKDGQFLARIPVKLDDVRGLILASKGEAGYLLTKDKIYQISLQL